jgi:hypothetical protein
MNTSPPADLVPAWLWRATALGLIAMVALIGAGVLLIAGGATDPPVAGPVVWADEALRWAAEALAAGRDGWASAPVPLPAPPADFTLAVRARLPAAANPLAAWGVWLAGADGSRTVYAISAAGYLTTRRCPAEQPIPDALEDCPALRPEQEWSAYPRIRPPGGANTVALHREPDGAIRLRVNGERLGAAQVDLAGAWGVWARGAGGESPRVTWERAELRAASWGSG